MFYTGFIQFYDDPHSKKDVDRSHGDPPHVSFMDSLDGIPLLVLPDSMRTIYSNKAHVKSEHSETKLRRLMGNPNKSTFPQELQEINGASETRNNPGYERVNKEPGQARVNQDHDHGRLYYEPSHERVNHIVVDKHDKIEKRYGSDDGIFLPRSVTDSMLPNSIVSVSGKDLRTALNKTSSCVDLQALYPYREYIASGWTKAVYSVTLHGEPVALKTVDLTGHDMTKCTQELGLSPTLCYIRASQKLLREILILRALGHTNVVKVS